jgi:hypothetical protein
MIDNVSLKYTYCLDISKLLQTQKLIDGVWKDVPYDAKNIETLPSAGKIETPELFTRYAYSSQHEIEHWKMCSKELSQLVFDVIDCKDANEGTDISLDSVYPCRATHWVAENQQSVSSNGKSNYTSDSSDVYTGKCPWKSITYEQNGEDKFKELDARHFTGMESIISGKSAYSEAGYGFLAHSDTIWSLEYEPGTSHGTVRAKWYVHQDSNVCGPDYRGKIKIRCLVVRRITFRNKHYGKQMDPVFEIFLDELLPGNSTEVVRQSIVNGKDRA